MIELRNIHKKYGAIRVLEGVSIKVENGSSLSIAGRSGCGKTTLLKMMALIIQPDKGSIVIDGAEVSNGGGPIQSLRSKISYSFQEPLLLPYLSVMDNLILTLSAPVTGTPSDLRRRGVEILTRFGLHDRLGHLPSKLSVGEKKRVDLARALVRGTPIVIADEPLASLDPERQGIVMTELGDFVKSGGTLIYSAVDPSEAEYADNSIQIGKI